MHYEVVKFKVPDIWPHIRCTCMYRKCNIFSSLKYEDIFHLATSFFVIENEY